MLRFFTIRFLAIVAGCSAALALGFGLWVWYASEAHITGFARPTPFQHPAPDDPETLAVGEHLVRTRGCSGCHGRELQGSDYFAPFIAPNLVQHTRNEDLATFEAAVRHGIGRDGRALFAMPAYNFLHLRDADLAAIYVYLQSQPEVVVDLPESDWPWSLRLDIAKGDDFTMPAVLDRVPPLRRAEDPDPRIARGEYLAMTTCNECHGFGLRADVPWEEEGGAPDLVIAAGYDFANFQKLMRTGIGLGERELGLMTDVAQGRFAYFTDQEVEDLHVFLHDFARRAASGEAASQ